MEATRPPRPQQIETLVASGCTCESWSAVRVPENFNPQLVRRVHFRGRVTLGSLQGQVTGPDGLRRPCGIENAVLVDCRVGAGCRIANIGSHIARYNIGDGVLIENVGSLTVSGTSRFGNGVSVSVLNEAGGREVPLCRDLSSQLAYLLCLYRFRPDLVAALRELINNSSADAERDRGTVGEGAWIVSSGQLADVWVGPYARINGVSLLRNGTVLSEKQAPAVVENGVPASDFISSEGAVCRDGVILDKVFVGQGCVVGKQFSAENSLFFANCEAFHGEAVSVFAGPYTVTHHKSTLLIAGLFSFYNAGSGTNQSNHRYKLGPVHEGKLARGTKTGSFAYLMWPCAVGPFSVVMGKHAGTFDTTEFPFSHIEARQNGRATMIPGLNLLTVGTLRDGAKWLARDRRTARTTRDALSFPVLSPYTVQLMIRGHDRLKALQESTDRSVEEVSVSGVAVPRPLLRPGQRYYRLGIELYLLEKLYDRIENAAARGHALQEALKPDPGAQGAGTWHDVGGLLVSDRRLEGLLAACEAGKITTVGEFHRAVQQIEEAFLEDEWSWVAGALRDRLSVDIRSLERGSLCELLQRYAATKGKFLRLVLADAEKEFDGASRTGYGLGGDASQVEADFDQVRGAFQSNSFVREVTAQIDSLEKRVAAVLQKLT